MMRRVWIAVLLLHAWTLSGQQPTVVFIDITAEAGIRWARNNGADGRKLLPESVGGGAAFLHADDDGRIDVLLINGKDWRPKGRKTLHGLFRNLGGGKFSDITAGSGLDVEMYGMGAAVADYDNDGREDVYVTALNGDRLFHNEGSGRFRDVTAAAGFENRGFAVSAAWLDYDRDGAVDLFVGNYVRWSPETDVRCSYDGVNKGYCGPQQYHGAPPRLYRNLGEGRFEDVTRKADVAEQLKALGVAVLDVDMDGWVDFFVANDQIPSRLYRNNRNGTFTDIGVKSGVALSEEGAARSNMGTDAADYDRSGRPHIAVGNFALEMMGLYHNEGTGLFIDQAPRSPVGRASLLRLTWAVYFLDYDLDGWLDIFAANGHIDEKWAGEVDSRIAYRQPLLMMRNLGKRRFEDATGRLGAAFSTPRLARGAAHGDVDGDGDLDLIVTTMDGPAALLRNDGGNRNNWIRIRAQGTKSNRSGLGAVVRMTSASGTQWQMVRSGSGYCSSSELALTFGLARDDRVRTVEIQWPSGLSETIENVSINQLLTATEGKGLSASRSRDTRSTPVR